MSGVPFTADTMAHEIARLYTLRPRAEYHEDFGTVLWWHLPIDSPPFVDCEPPQDCARGMEPYDWFTHWSPLPDCTMMMASDGTVTHE